MPKFGKQSQDRLATCHPKIQLIMNEAIKAYDFTVLCGTRTPEEQFELVRVLTSQAYANKLKEAETLFYKKRVWSVLKD